VPGPAPPADPCLLPSARGRQTTRVASYIVDVMEFSAVYSGLAT